MSKYIDFRETGKESFEIQEDFYPKMVQISLKTALDWDLGPKAIF